MEMTVGGKGKEERRVMGQYFYFTKWRAKSQYVQLIYGARNKELTVIISESYKGNQERKSKQ